MEIEKSLPVTPMALLEKTSEQKIYNIANHFFLCS